MAAWSCRWCRRTHPSTGYVPYSLTMSTVQLNVLFWGTESTNPTSSPITIVNAHLMSLHTKHSTLSPEFARISIRASLFVCLNHSDLFEFELVLFWPGFALVLPQPIAISWTWLSVSSHSSTSHGKDKFLCLQLWLSRATPYSNFRRQFFNNLLHITADRKSASRSSTFSQCWAKCLQRISSLRCFHSELLVSSELYWSNSSSSPLGDSAWCSQVQVDRVSRLCGKGAL